MKLKHLISAISFFLFLGFLLAESSVAENVFSWQDKEGRTHYGPKPPRQALNKKQVNPKTFSTYSTKKLFKGYGLPYSRASIERPSQTKSYDSSLPPVEMNTKPKAAEKNENLASKKLPKVEKTAKEDLKSTLTETKLLQLSNNTKFKFELLDPIVVTDSSGQVVSCSAMIKNISNKPAQGIAAEFSFGGKGKLVGEGPSEIPIGTLGYYEVNRKNLPVTLKQGNLPTMSLFQR